MSLPDTGDRGDIVVQVEFDPVNLPGVYTNWCGATGFNLQITNEVTSQKVGDCDNWGLPIQNQKNYGAQNVTASMDATWTAATHLHTSDWALNQKKLRTRIHFPNALAGQVERYDGVGLLTGLTLDGVGNVEGQPQTESVSLEYSGGLERTLKS